MREYPSSTWKTRVTLLAIAAGLMLGGVSLGETGVDAARKRGSTRKQQEFSNRAAITITDNQTSPPSSIQVSGFTAPVTEVMVSFHLLSHTQPADMDILLVGPGGQTAMLISDAAAASGPAVNANIVIRDGADKQIPSQEAMTSGAFQPTNYEYTNNPDSFSPHPRIPSPLPNSSSLAIFNGTDANGEWLLFIDDGDDDNPNSSGSLASGWSLRITTANGAPQTSPDTFQARAGQLLTVPAGGVLDNDSDPDGETLTATLAGTPKKGTLELAPDGSFTYRANKKAKGPDTFTYLAQDEKGLTALETATIQIKGKKKKRKR